MVGKSVCKNQSNQRILCLSNQLMAGDENTGLAWKFSDPKLCTAINISL